MHKGKSERGGFSLIEVVVAMVILSLILASVFGVVWQAADSAAELRVLDARDQQVSRFLRLYRKTLESLPAGTTVTITTGEKSLSGQEEMKIEGAVTAYAMGVNEDTDGETIIALRPQLEKKGGELDDYVGPLFQVAVSREDFKPIAKDGEMAIRVGESDPFFEVDDDGRYWLPLLDNIVSMTWRYWDAGQMDWTDSWQSTSMPEMLELSLLDPWRPAPLRVVFEMPGHLVQNTDAGEGTELEEPSGTSSGRSSGGAAGQRPPAAGADRDGAKGGGDGRGKGGRTGNGGRAGGSRDAGGARPAGTGAGARGGNGGANGTNGASTQGGGR
ncbi:MAG: prepilin-type N-terminal cleavage/methylation domain-containing protein [Verrucomicrobiota bacterium]